MGKTNAIKEKQRNTVIHLLTQVCLKDFVHSDAVHKFSKMSLAAVMRFTSFPKMSLAAVMRFTSFPKMIWSTEMRFTSFPKMIWSTEMRFTSFPKMIWSTEMRFTSFPKMIWSTEMHFKSFHKIIWSTGMRFTSSPAQNEWPFSDATVRSSLFSFVAIFLIPFHHLLSAFHLYSTADHVTG